MKKIRLALIATAIIGAFASAYTTRPCELCWGSMNYVQIQGPGGTYYRELDSYSNGSNFGITYDCNGTSGWCTYYRPDPIGMPNYYAPCRVGSYTPIDPKPTPGK